MELGDLEDPFLSGDGVEGRSVLEREQHIARRHEDQLCERSIHGGQRLSESANRFPDSLNRDAGVEELLSKARASAPGTTRVGGFDTFWYNWVAVNKDSKLLR